MKLPARTTAHSTFLVQNAFAHFSSAIFFIGSLEPRRFWNMAGQGWWNDSSWSRSGWGDQSWGSQSWGSQSWPAQPAHRARGRAGPGRGRAQAEDRSSGSRSPSPQQQRQPTEARLQRHRQHKYADEEVLRCPWPGPRMTTFPKKGEPGSWAEVVDEAEAWGLAQSLVLVQCSSLQRQRRALVSYFF